MRYAPNFWGFFFQGDKLNDLPFSEGDTTKKDYVIMGHFFSGWYDETPLKNQEWQIKYGLRKEFIHLLINEDITPEQRKRLDILHHGTEEQIKQLAENYNKNWHGSDNTKLPSVFGRWYNNNITSAYGRNDNNFFIEQIKLGNLVYQNKQKSLEWTNERGLPLPPQMSTQGFLNIIQKEDVVNQKTPNFSLSERRFAFTEYQQEWQPHVI